MALNLINTTLAEFVQFAQSQVAAGKGKAVARLDESVLGGIVHRNIKPGSGDWVGVGAGRLSSLKNANNITREAFKIAVAGMFGGEKRIPDSVKDGICSMTIDDIPMEFTESPGGEAVIGVAVVGEPPPERREAFYETLLEANTPLSGTRRRRSSPGSSGTAQDSWAYRC